MFKNEDLVKYDCMNTEENIAESMILDAKIKLTGRNEKAKTIANFSELGKFCIDLFADSACEEFHVICVDARCRVISESTISTGDLTEVPVYTRKIATIALLSNAKGVFLSHNHPGGTCSPSAEDINSTQKIIQALSIFNISVLDHMIITPEHQTYSFAQHGDLFL